MEISSFAKALFLGEIHEQLAFPYPRPSESEVDRVRSLIASLREFAADAIDSRAIEERGWIGDDVVRELGELGFCGLYVPEEYGGQGLSHTGYCRVFEIIAQIDAALSVLLGVHQSIGYKGIALFGSDEQKERFLPDLRAPARRLRPHRAGRRLRPLQPPEPRGAPVGWLVEAQRPEALEATARRAR